MTTIHWCGTGLSSGPGLRRLLENGHKVVVWNRTVAKAQEVVGDLTDVPSVRAALSSVRTLFLLNAVTPDEVTQYGNAMSFWDVTGGGNAHSAPVGSVADVVVDTYAWFEPLMSPVNQVSAIARRSLASFCRK